MVRILNFQLLLEQGTRRSNESKRDERDKKLKSIFIDHKVPIDRRETWPVVTDGKNRILWLPGLKKCYDADTLDKGEGYILITYHSK